MEERIRTYCQKCEKEEIRKVETLDVELIKSIYDELCSCGEKVSLNKNDAYSALMIIIPEKVDDDVYLAEGFFKRSES